MKWGQLLEFEVAFPGEQRKRPEEYLHGGSRSVILNVASYFLGFKPIKSIYSDNKIFLGHIFGKENNDFANDIYDRVKPIEDRGTTIGIVNPFCSLKLFEIFFAIEENIETQTPAEFERNLFKAYLVITSEFTIDQSIAFSSVEKLDDVLKLPMKIFCSQYPVSDKINFDLGQIWTTQIIKSIYLFEFLEENEKTKPLLKAFLTYFNKPTWQEYLKKLLPLTASDFKKEKESHTDITVNPGESFEEDCSFIEKLSVFETDELDEYDFLTLRSKPLYKIKDGVYRIIFNLFVVEKIFKGVYFFLRDINNCLPKKEKIKDWRSFYGFEISEKVLSYKVIESIYPNNRISFTGQELENMKIDGAPDYYIRKGKNILLFESKDFLIRADKKISFDFEVYEPEFQKVLYYEDMPDGTEKHKAVMQLISNIRRLLKNGFEADKDYRYKDVFIYPILLTHDHQYDTAGFNNLIDYWFQEELEELKEDGLFINHVKPLTVINVDSLIYHQVALSKHIELHTVLKDYHDQIKLKPRSMFKTYDEYEAHQSSKIIPFSLFIYNYFQERGLRELPPVMEVVGSALFKDEI